MKKFIIQTITFAAFAAGVVITFHFLFLLMNASKLRLPSDVHTIYMGNSTIETSVNDTIVPHSFNMGKGADHIEFVYAKLKMLKRVNPQIDTLVVGLDDIILYKENDNDWPKWGINSPFFITEFDIDDHISNLRNFSFKWNSGYLTSMYDGSRWLYLSMRKDGIPRDLGVGGYEYLLRDKLQLDIKKNKDHHLKQNDPDSVSEGIIHYFRKMMTFCNSNGITLIFMSTPKHKEVWNKRAYREIHSKYFPEIPLYDFTEITYPDSCYGDVVHLNYRGARVFSEQLAQGFDSVRSTVPIQP